MAQIPVVGHDQERDRAVGAVEQPDVIDECEDHRVGGASTAVANGHAGRDPLVPEAALWRSIEDDLDRGGRRDGAAKPADEGGGRGRA